MSRLELLLNVSSVVGSSFG